MQQKNLCTRIEHGSNNKDKKKGSSDSTSYRSLALVMVAGALGLVVKTAEQIHLLLVSDFVLYKHDFRPCCQSASEFGDWGGVAATLCQVLRA
jgi:hypothetical protein